MNDSTLRAARPLRAVLMAALAGAACGAALAQQVENPGDIIVMRDVTPRIAYDHVPKNQDPVLVRGTTFPATSFDPMMATLVSDTDLTNAHGSNGVSPDGLPGGGMQAITRVLAGNPAGAGASVVRGPVGGAGTGGIGGIGGIGGVVAGSVTNALVPVASALGVLK